MLQMISIVVLVLESIYATSMPLTTPTLSMYRGMGVFVDVWCVLLLHTLDVVFTVTLLVGAHMVRGLYDVTDTIASFLYSQQVRAGYALAIVLSRSSLKKENFALQLKRFVITLRDAYDGDVNIRIGFCSSTECIGHRTHRLAAHQCSHGS